MTEPAAPGLARVHRLPLRGWLGGVCEGIGSYLGVHPTLLRLAFVLLASWSLSGALAYFLVWLLLPDLSEEDAHKQDAQSPGLEAHTRRGLRPRSVTITAARRWGELLALVCIGVGATWMVQASGLGLSGTWFVAGVLLALGLALVWWQADHVSPRGIRISDGPLAWLAPLLRHWTTVLGLAIGLVAVTAAIIVAAISLPFGGLSRTLIGITLALLALGAAGAPWALRVRRSLTRAHEQKLVADARADMAAHLHDSVLQTLALIQKQSNNPSEVTRLARRQERELRAWLYGKPVIAGTLSAALKEIAQEVEDDFPINVEVVTVGDIESCPAVEALVQAAREAMTNAAKHSGAPSIDLYGEVDGRDISVYVRDRGKGFDPDVIAEGRMGVKRSILGRMERHGGRAEIRSAPDYGTNIILEITA